MLSSNCIQTHCLLYLTMEYAYDYVPSLAAEDNDVFKLDLIEDNQQMSLLMGCTGRLDSVGSSRTPSPASCYSPDSPDEIQVSATIGSLENIASRVSDLNNSSSGTEKPKHTFVALISMAILNSTDKKLLLGDICKYITDRFPYYGDQNKTWRSNIRYNLSTNECFVKDGKEHGKGFYWAVHPSCVSEFSRGDYSRRKPKKRARRAGKRQFVKEPEQVYTKQEPSANQGLPNVQNPWSVSGTFSLIPNLEDFTGQSPADTLMHYGYPQHGLDYYNPLQHQQATSGYYDTYQLQPANTYYDQYSAYANMPFGSGYNY